MPQLELPHTPGCLVCGRTNPIGLHLSLHVHPDTNEITTTFTPTPNHIGFENLLHGGVLATVLDEAMVWAAIWNARRACVAGELTVRFRRPGRVNDPLTCTATVTAARSRMIETAGTITNAANETIATATAKYVPLPDPATQEFFKTLVPDPATRQAAATLTSRG
jgi:uncharacterized protein (TIGR00369 family)